MKLTKVIAMLCKETALYQLRNEFLSCEFKKKSPFDMFGAAANVLKLAFPNTRNPLYMSDLITTIYEYYKEYSIILNENMPQFESMKLKFDIITFQSLINEKKMKNGILTDL